MFHSGFMPSPTVVAHSLSEDPAQDLGFSCCQAPTHGCIFWTIFWASVDTLTQVHEVPGDAKKVWFQWQSCCPWLNQRAVVMTIYTASFLCVRGFRPLTSLRGGWTSRARSWMRGIGGQRSDAGSPVCSSSFWGDKQRWSATETWLNNLPSLIATLGSRDPQNSRRWIIWRIGV